MKRMFALASVCVLAMTFGIRAEDKPAEGKPGAGKPGKGGHGMMIAKLFEKADANNDGKVSLDEFKKAVENAPKGKLKDHPEKAAKLFKRLDADGDGFVTKEELKKAMEKMAEHAKKGKKGKKTDDA